MNSPNFHQVLSSRSWLVFMILKMNNTIDFTKLIFFYDILCSTLQRQNKNNLI